MRTTIEIDDELLAEAKEVAGTATHRATIDFALRELVRRKARSSVLDLRGRVEWLGELDDSRDQGPR